LTAPQRTTDLRHNFITEALAGGVDALIVASITSVVGVRGISKGTAQSPHSVLDLTDETSKLKKRHEMGVKEKAAPYARPIFLLGHL
jgi:hypothetical protein